MTEAIGTFFPAVPLAHAGEFHVGDLLIATPLLILMVVGAVLFIRAARGDADTADGTDATEGPAPPAGAPRRESGAADEAALD